MAGNMTSAQDRVLHVTELLEGILSFLSMHDILINAQRVSKRWRDVIETSPEVRKAIFLFPSSTSLFDKEVYSKNRKILYVFPQLFSVHLDRDVSFHNKPWGFMDLMSDTKFHFPSGLKERWLTNNASWRNMYVSQPPIEKIYWHIQNQTDRRVSMPGIVVTFEFPGGLRMGDYYDLIIGTKGAHRVLWPQVEGKGVPESSDADNQYQWFTLQRSRADREHAILVVQFTTRTRVYPPERDSFWNPRDLQIHHENLRVLETLEVSATAPAVTWRYLIPEIDSASAMKIFLHEARD
ncbi:hypothetical protein F5Y11DRAFT_189655 [Daldinia sp. FL1419]|nr:hypothetical protein F5Y11DRAFT_189655 [Daldinia sp. FL1419]